MPSTAISQERADPRSPGEAIGRGPGRRGLGEAVLAQAASLRLTVMLFALSIFIVLVGTLAQVDKDMWEVMDDYFRAWMAWIDFQVFFPRSWFPRLQGMRGGFWFPGGALIGLALAVNLLAAQLPLFRVPACGARLAAGVSFTFLGAILTAMVILSGHNREGLQGEPPFAWGTLWTFVKMGLGGLCAACAWGAFRARSRGERVLLGVVAAVLGLVTAGLFAPGTNAYLGDAGMRILWQLTQAGSAALILLLGCVLVFGARGSNLLTHGGLALLMFGQFYVGRYDVEEQMTIQEGETVRFAQDIRQTELAIVDPSSEDADDVVVIPQRILLASARGRPPSLWERLRSGSLPLGGQGVIQHPDLPFDVKVVSYYRNAELHDARPGEPNPATAGTGLQFVAQPARSSSGTDRSSRVDLAAAYVKFLRKNSAEELGTYLVSQIAAAHHVPERVAVGGTTYEVSLRFKQNYKPYSVTLLDVRKDDYLGTSTPRNYSSDIRLVAAGGRVDRKVRIWMNNPLRYAGETFYQSGYAGPPDVPLERSTLQVVTNSGWMIPYVACMLVGTGMLAHFTASLLGFLRRREAERGQSAEGAVGASGRSPRALRTGLAILLALLAGWVVAAFLPPRNPPGTMNLHEFGALPLVADGRVKPFDTLARNTLRIISNRETFQDASGKRQPAIRWLLDVIADPKAAEEHRVFRILHPEVLDTLGLRRRPGNVYSVGELRRGIEEFQAQVTRARERSPAEWGVFERKLLELDRQLQAYLRVTAAFQPPDVPPLPSSQDDAETRQRKLQAFGARYEELLRELKSAQPALAVPLQAGGERGAEPRWESYARAWVDASLHGALGRNPDRAFTHLQAIFAAYQGRDAGKFHQRIAEYRSLLDKDPRPELKGGTAAASRLLQKLFGSYYGFEAYFNRVAPFYRCSVLYVMAFLLAALAWLGWSRPLNRAAFLLLAATFCLHTLALGARIYISGRPPVTNLYSSAVFVGWGVVLLAGTFELVFRNGVGNAVAAVWGFASLIIAHHLAGVGDTITVLQAVLDTQFWLATHVVCITFGYATTFLAGGLGILYVLRGVCTPTLTPGAGRELARMIYGIICFSIFFSFLGTVLGGLWADDSWGRFWGWDPKENGALIIVLWNALVLHAWRDGMAKERGLAVLAVGGNIVTSWSWFGVNELGVGLHSYGFTEGVLLALGLFVASQLAIIALGMLPRSLWWSFRARPQAPRQVAVA